MSENAASAEETLGEEDPDEPASSKHVPPLKGQIKDFTGIMDHTPKLAPGAYGIVAKKRKVTGQSVTMVTCEEGTGGCVVGTLAEESTVKHEETHLISKPGPSSPRSVPAHYNATSWMGPYLRKNATESGMGSVVGIITYGSFNAHNVNVNVQQNLVPPSYPLSPVKAFWTVAAPIPTFVGRQQMLESVHNKLQRLESQQHYLRRVVALVAIGGMGKTEIARKFAQTYRKYYKNVAWIDSDTNSSTHASFIKLCDQLRLPHYNSSGGKEVAQLVYRHVGNDFPQPTLFIFDNANRLKSEGSVFGIFDYLPTEQPEHLPLILLTSQNTEWRRYGCETFNVPWLSEKEALQFFLLVFKITRKNLRRDEELQDLLKSLIWRLNGYPLALGLAAANISFIPEQDPLDLLKQQLRKYITSVDDNQIWKQRVDTQLATDYPRTLLIVWDIAMKNLEKREHGEDAKQLLFILAQIPPEKIDRSMAERAYGKTSERFGVTFPAENGASFEEALHELRAVCIIEADAKIKVHRLVQTLGALSDDMGLGIQKIALYNLEMGTLVDVGENCLWSQDGGVPAWALECEWKALLWLQGLRFMSRQRVKNEAVGKELRWKDQLSIFANGADIALVADLLSNNQFPKHYWWTDDVEWEVEILCSLIGKVVQVKQSFTGSTPEIRVFLELLLLTILMVSLKAVFYKLVMTLSLTLPSREVLVAVKTWLSDVDFSMAYNLPDASMDVPFVVDVLVNSHRIISLFHPEIKFTEPKVIFEEAKARLAVCGGKCDSDKIILNLVGIWNPDDAEELMRDHSLLDHLSSALEEGPFKSGFHAQGILLQLVRKPDLVHKVIEHERLMESIMSSYDWDGEIPSPSGSFLTESVLIWRYKPSGYVVEKFPNAVQGIIRADNDRTWECFIVYRTMMIYAAIYTNFPAEERRIGGRLAKLLPPKHCKHALSYFATIDLCRSPAIEDHDWRYLYDCNYPFMSKGELEEDKLTLSCGLEKVQGNAESLLQDECDNLLLQLVHKLIGVNEYFLSAFEVVLE